VPYLAALGGGKTIDLKIHLKTKDHLPHALIYLLTDFGFFFLFFFVFPALLNVEYTTFYG
jgi:hypothetical protein